MHSCKHCGGRGHRLWWSPTRFGRRSRFKARLESIWRRRKNPCFDDAHARAWKRSRATDEHASKRGSGRQRLYFTICEPACLRGDRSQPGRSSAQSPCKDAAARSRIAPAPTDRTCNSARARALPSHRLSLCRRDGAPMMRSAVTLNRAQL
jgi:hypothetical protein